VEYVLPVGLLVVIVILAVRFFVKQNKQ
jgi:hypothetical protein